jgi:Protein of unknown function (DUF1176)
LSGSLTRDVTACLALGLTWLLPSVASAQTRQFQNWVVGCDNAHVCTAIVFAEPSKAVAEPGIPLLQIRHHPQRDATPEIRIFDPAPVAEGDRLVKSSARLIAKPTGAEAAKGPVTHGADFEGNGGFRFRSNSAWSLLNSLRSRETITISIGEKRNLRVNTAGLEAALAYIDVHQELDDTPGALVKKPKGVLNDYLHPTPPDIDTVEGIAFGEASDGGIVPNTLPAASRCLPATPNGNIESYPLRGSTILLRRECGVDVGNAMSAWYMLPGNNGRATLHPWPVGDSGKRLDGALLANAEVLPNGGVIRATRYRAATKDCGTLERWAWTKEGKFALIERREMPLCRTAGPAHWIITYRANFISPD